MKKSGLLKLIVAVVVIFFLVRLCSQNFGSVITLPGGMGGSNTGGKTSDESGGWFSPKNQPGSTSTTTDPDIADLERELGVGSNKGRTTTTTTPSTTTTTSTTSSSTPLSFKGIPMTGSASAFGNELVRAGFKNNGNGTYTGSFAGYNGCKITPVGNPVQEVRVDFPVISDWDTLEKAYDNLQADLTKKYGKEPRTSTNNNLAVYDLDNGLISLDADVKDKSTWHVILTYSNAPTLTMGTTTSGGSAFDDL